MAKQRSLPSKEIAAVDILDDIVARGVAKMHSIKIKGVYGVIIKHWLKTPTMIMLRIRFKN